MNQVIYDSFRGVVDRMTRPLEMEEAQREGQAFIADYVPPTMIANRRELYDMFKKLSDYAKMHMAMHMNTMSEPEKLKYHNMCTLAKGIKWAVEHDGHDLVRDQPVQEWGHDIMAMKGKM